MGTQGRALGEQKEQPNSTRQKKHLGLRRLRCSESRQNWTRAPCLVPGSSSACGVHEDVALL